MANSVGAGGQRKSAIGGGEVLGKKSASNQPAQYKHTTTIYETHKLPVYGAAFNPWILKPEAAEQEEEEDEAVEWLATCGSRSVHIYRLCAQRTESMIAFQDPNKDECFYALTWALDEIVEKHVVVVGGAKGIIRVIDLQSKNTCNTLRGHGESINELRTSPTNPSIVASASKDRTARLWNIRNADCLAIFGGAYGHLDEVISLDFDHDQQFLLTTSMDHTVRVWEMNSNFGASDSTGDGRRAVENHFPLAVCRDAHTNYVDCGRFMGDFIISKSCENSLILWKFGAFELGAAGAGTILRTETYVMQCAWMELPKAETWFLKFDLHPKNHFLACGNEMGEIHLWRLDSGDFPQRKSDFQLKIPDSAVCLRQCVFSPSGRILIAVGELGIVSRFDWST